jgi:two-component system sensor histidine kinase BaeS
VSFRLRVLALVALVAVTAVGATAYLAFKQASRQVTESAAADSATTNRIVTDLANFARVHGTWEGVPRIVEVLTRTTGQRIRLVTEDGQVIVDTDTLAGRATRPVTSQPTLVDPRPRLSLPADLSRLDPYGSILVSGTTVESTPGITVTPPGMPRPPGSSPIETTVPTVDPKLAAEDKLGRGGTWVAMAVTQREIQLYRSGVRLAACLSRHGVRTVVLADPLGVPRYGVDPASARATPDPVTLCRAAAGATDRASSQEISINACAKVSPQLGSCLQQAFSAEVEDVAPVPLRVYLGAIGDAPRRLAPGPVIAAAVLVALLALAGTALLSRRVLRPIGVLTSAAHRLGAGDLSLRVPAVGRDELAQLARSFNRMADSLQRGEERQRRLVADVAHELRTPLANLRGYLEALKDGVLPISPELFASLHEEAVLQQRIVDDLQDLALAEAGVLAYHMASTDLTELLETCRNAQQAVAEAARVTLRVAADGPVVALVDPDRLRQVLGNLVANAVRATPAGGSVTLSAAGPVGGWATLTVRDTGVGIAADNLPHVFDRFWRADAARGRATGGSGLGLAIARQIVADHGGQIRVESQPGAGTTFTIALPARSARGH